MLLYGKLGEFPYGEDAVTAIEGALASYPEQTIVVLAIEDASGKFLTGRLGLVNPVRLNVDFLIPE